MHTVWWLAEVLLLLAAGRMRAQGTIPPAPTPQVPTPQAETPMPPSPEWSRGVVWYQILIDRFANGDPANDPKAQDLFDDPSDPWTRSEWTDNWYNISVQELEHNPSFYPNAFRRQYGGDLEGIRRHVDYLAALGVEGVILSPVFESRSSHKCDPATWHHVDRRFGPYVPSDTIGLGTEQPDNPKSWFTTSADRQFVALIREFHARGIKVVVQMQVAHVSVHFWAFRDVLARQENSPYANWFTVNEWDRPETPTKSEFSYKSMWGIEAFPELRIDSLGLAAGPRAYMQAMTRRWMDPNADGNPSDGIDGWYIDLAGELPSRFWREWVRLVKSINPEALTIGGPLDAEPGIPSPFDIVTNDTFGAEVVRCFLNRISTPTTLDRELTALTRDDDDPEAADRRINRISDLETDRLASMCVNAANPHEQDNSPQRNPRYQPGKPTDADRAMQRLLLVLQFTWPGSPMLLYGDEAGMWGGDDPDCRKPMLWPDLTFKDECSFSINGDPARHTVTFDSAMFTWYGSLTRLRKEHLALRTGSFRTTMIDDVKRLYGFVRQSGADRVHVLVNASDNAQECSVIFPDVPVGSRVEAVLQHQFFYVPKGGLNLIVPARTALVLIPEY